MQSAPTTQQQWLTTLWYDVTGNNQAPLPAHLIPVLIKGYNNLPVFLQHFCFLYYHQQLTLQQMAKTLGISLRLANQRWVVSIALFRILLAAKPKNPV